MGLNNMAMTLAAINQLEMAKTLVALEVNSSSQELRAWVAVYPKLQEKNINYFEVRFFEIRKELVESNFSQVDVLNSRNKKVETIKEVESILSNWDVDSESLQVPWRCDYPL